MENASGQGPAPTTVDWSKVLGAVGDAATALETTAAKLSTARDQIAESKDRSGAELALLKEELDDVRGRFETLKEALDSQSGPVVEAVDESGDEPTDKDDG